MIEHEEGHLFPTFRLARQLAARGHRIVYLALADGVEIIRTQGFAAHTILGEVFPAGSMRTLRASSAAPAGPAESGGAAGPLGSPGADIPPQAGRPAFAAGRPGPGSDFARAWSGLLDGDGELDSRMRELRPDLLVLTSFYLPHALVLRARYRLPVVLLTPLLRSEPKSAYATAVGRLLMHAGAARQRFAALMAGGHEAPRAADLAQRILAQILRTRELILCPAELELPELRRDAEPEVHYVEPMVDVARHTGRELAESLFDARRRLLYVSMGSQSHAIGRQALVRLLRAIGAAFAERPDWQVVIASGGGIDPAEVPPPAGGLTLAWAPQLQLLGRAAVAITHGGLGSVKECIWSGVPMVVFPGHADQPGNARRIVHHRLGAAGEIAHASPADVAALVLEADSAATRAAIDRMRQCFLAAERAARAADLVEERLAASPAAAPSIAPTW